MTDFQVFAKAVHDRYNEMTKHELFVVDTQDIFTSYLLAFPEGTNPIYRTNTEHDCSCCKNFVRNLGNLVAIVDGKRMTVWDNFLSFPEPYGTVAARMVILVKQAPIVSVFRTKEHSYGAEVTREQTEAGVKSWHHFHGKVSGQFRCDNPSEVKGSVNTRAQVFKRALEELKPEAVTQVIELIEANALYRGQEHLNATKGFALAQKMYAQADDKELYVWSNAQSSFTNFRNSVIGTLVQDLSEGVDLERAVRSFETKVAPANYKRSSSLITPRMIDDAVKTLETLGLDTALNRRYANTSDMSVNDVLWVDGAVRGHMKDNLRDLLSSAVKPRKTDNHNAISIQIEDFMKSILPGAKKMEMLVSNKHTANFMSLTAPTYPNAKQLFKWDNGFGWNYDGDVTDSIKERVKRAGGKTNAPLRVSLSWSNTDDLDLHTRCPDGHIFYGNKRMILDVDMNNGFTTLSREPVENLSWMHPSNGRYEIIVNQYSRRQTSDVGFTLEIECQGDSQQFHYAPAVQPNESVLCFQFEMLNGEIKNLRVMNSKLIAGNASIDKWGVKTEEFTPVNMVMLSPNHWENAGGVGNKHWFFILKNCVNPGEARGIYNEFLRNDLEKHRKVFEVLGSKTKCRPTDKQLSGLGFSSTQKNEVVMRVTAADSVRTYNVSF